MGALTWGLKATLPNSYTQSCRFVDDCWALSCRDFRREMMIIVGTCGKLRTNALNPPFESPHLDFPDFVAFCSRRFETLLHFPDVPSTQTCLPTWYQV